MVSPQDFIKLSDLALELGHIPKSWLEANIVLIHKVEKDPLI